MLDKSNGHDSRKPKLKMGESNISHSFSRESSLRKKASKKNSRRGSSKDLVKNVNNIGEIGSGLLNGGGKSSEG